MIKHTHTEKGEVNFANLKKRILAINDPIYGNYNKIREFLYKLSMDTKPVLIMATGGSKVIAYYLQLILERMGPYGILSEIIEPRDYFYKANTELYGRLVAISASGKTNGIKEVLENFKGDKFLLCENPIEADFESVSWGNELYEKEKSFISLASSIGPITLLLEATTSLNMDISPSEVRKINDKVKTLLEKSMKKIEKILAHFENTHLVQILSGYDTRTSAHVLESNLAEVGLAAPVIHDKSSYCHGRSNLVFTHPNCQMLYLTHGFKELDTLLIEVLWQEYHNLSVFSTEEIDDTIFWKEYYLLLQMYFLSKKIADDKKIDFTQPEYNPNIIQKVYNFKGGM